MRCVLAVAAPATDPAPDPAADPSARPGGAPLPGSRWWLALLLVATAAGYLVELDRSGFGNDFYAAAAQAGSQSWEAFLFGSSDAGNSITVDKPPAALWPVALSVRLFGLSSWSALVPQVLMGVASVALLHATVRRAFGARVGLLAGLVLALTPVAVLMFRFDNPDALLVLCSVAAAWAVLRGVEDGRTRWLLLAGALLGLGFLAKQLQVALVVLPLAVTYLVAGRPRLRRRLGQLTLGGLVAVAGAGWWVATVSLVPGSERPYVGGTATNSVLDLTLGYNGLGRLTGRETLGNGATRAQGSGFTFGGSHGLVRLLTGSSAGEIGWLAPAAAVLGVLGLALTLRVPRTDLRRAHLLLWTLWLGVSAAVFAGMSGIYHDYYTVALAPPVAALVATGGAVLWARRDRWWGGLLLGVAVAGTTTWAFVLLGGAPGTPGGLSTPGALRWAVLGAGALLGVVLVLRRSRGRLGAGVAAAVVLVGLAGPAAWSVGTVLAPHVGSSPVAGPAPRHVGAPTDTVPAEVVGLLQRDADRYTWVAATNGSEQAARFQLASGHAVAPLGGFTGLDPSPTLAQFQGWVAQRRVHYYVGGGLAGLLGGGAGHRALPSSQIASWVHAHYASHTVAGVALYDLSR